MSFGNENPIVTYQRDPSSRLVRRRLEAQGLTEQQINIQNVEELENSLTKIDEMISDPEWSSAGAAPRLLGLKSLILKRISVLRPQAQLGELKDAVAKVVQDPMVREPLLRSLDESIKEAVAQAQSLQKQAEQTDQERERMLMTIELKERTSAMRRSWFERESVASIVGALLLLSLGGAVIISMFTHTPASQIVTSSFLLILGYFFGQAGRSQTRQSPTKPDDRAD